MIVNFVFPLVFLIKRGNKRNFKIIGFGSALLIFGHYVDFFNYTFVEPNWNHELDHKHQAKVETEKVVLYAANEEHHLTATTTDATPAHENTEAVATEVKHEEAKHEGDAHAHEATTEGEHGGHGEAEVVANYASINIGEVLVFIGFLGAFLFLFFRNLAKRPITPENDPYLKECERIVVTYS